MRPSVGELMGDPTAFLRVTTIAVDMAGLATALWLGLYLVGRSPRRPVAWLTALTLWSAAGVFLNGLLALNPPPDDLPKILRFLIPFWPARAGEGADARFFHQGWAVTPAVIFWHHATLLLRPERIDRPRRWRIVLGYLIALSAILIQAYAPQLFATTTGGTLYHDTFEAGPAYPVIALALLIFTGLCLANLSTAGAAQRALRGQLRSLKTGTLLAGATAPVFVITTLLRIPVPLVLDALLLAAGIVSIGYGIVHYSAFLEGRVVPRDFLYQAAAVAFVTLVYLGVTWFSVATYRVPSAAFTFVVVLAIITHSLVASGRSFLDSWFFHSEALRLRRAFRRLATLAGEQESLQERLQRPLEALCRSVNATFGLVYLDSDGQASTQAVYGWTRTPPPILSSSAIAADDLSPVRPGLLPPVLADVCLVSPLYQEAHQHGALLLGCPNDALGFNEADLELIAQASDRLAATVANAREQQVHLERMEALVQPESRLPTVTGDSGIRAVESALRNLFDFAYLGNHSLGRFLSLQRYLPRGQVTLLERGKALHNLIAEAIERFRPLPERPPEPPPREWYPYLILRSAYLEGVSNRDIMARLYISEGTFNRTRRAAVHALATAMAETEASASLSQPDSDHRVPDDRAHASSSARPHGLAASGSDASGTGTPAARHSAQTLDQ
jgi:hypothetical protein